MARHRQRNGTMSVRRGAHNLRGRMPAMPLKRPQDDDSWSFLSHGMDSIISVVLFSHWAKMSAPVNTTSVALLTRGNRETLARAQPI
jgi:hypothetical protein